MIVRREGVFRLSDKTDLDICTLNLKITDTKTNTFVFYIIEYRENCVRKRLFDALGRLGKVHILWLHHLL